MPDSTPNSDNIIDLFDIPDPTAPPTVIDTLDTDYQYTATFLAYSVGFSSRPSTAEVEIKLRVPAAFRDAAEVLDRNPGMVGRVDIWIPKR